MIWWIDSKTLMKEYVNEPQSMIEKGTYLILSSRILNTETRPNVLNMYSTFMSLNQLKGVDVLTDIDSRQARIGFKDYLLKHHKIVLFLVEVIAHDMELNGDTLFIIHEDDPVGNIEVFTDVFEELFKYRIEKYPKVSKARTNNMAKIVQYYRDEIDDTMLKCNSDSSVERVLKSMDKSELRGMMMRQHMEYHGLDKSEMIDELMKRRN